MLYKFKLDHNATEATKNICYAKGEGKIPHYAVTKWFKKSCLSCKNFNDQAKKVMWTQVGTTKRQLGTQYKFKDILK